MRRSIWVTLFTILGLIALSVLIWFVGPLIGWPVDMATKIIVISAIWLFAMLIWLIRWLVRRRRARALEAEVAGSHDDTPLLREKMQDAMETLRRTSGRGGSAFLYDLPWYIIIGPPGSGKTTALVNSGLKFPLSGGAQAIAGVGGTRHCDWWFTEEAVMIDTAGRYTTQDSDSEADARSWTGFLDMLAENRPRQPINGVLVCISVEDVMTLRGDELDQHANAIRRRLDELHNRLKIGFPVYVMLTKTDLVAGFMEFFGDLTPDQRAIVWGTTFQPKNKNDNMVNSFGEEFDALMQALSEQSTDRLQLEPDSRARARIFGFPSQMASLKGPVTEFLTKVFETTRYQADAALRGVYFTSGTQEGTPIDRVLGALSRNFGAQGAGMVAFSGRGRSFFLTDLLQKVVFAESGWVSTNLRHIRRMFFIRSAMYTMLLLGFLGVGAAWGWSYLANTEHVRQNDQAIDEYRELAAARLTEARIGDGELFSVLSPLDKLRFMPMGYSTRDESVPLTEGFGLSQHRRLRRANVAAYRDALDRMFLPRLIWRLENLLSKKINDPFFVYEGLKVYMMLGGLQKMDADLVGVWMTRDWQNLYPGAANQEGRKRLMEHLIVILDRPSSDVALNGPLVKEAQRTLARMPLADRVYTLMKSHARLAAYPPWNAYERAGEEEAELVFETRDGAPLSDVRIDGFFTYDGFHNGLLAKMEEMIAESRKERWVLGEEGAQAAVEAQYKTIRQNIMDRYRTEFIAAWDQQLGRLKIAPVGSGSDLTMMSALAAPTSPLKKLMESIRDETQLTKVPEGAETGAAGEAAAAASRRETERQLTAGATSAAGRIGTSVALGALDDAAAAGGAPAINYGVRIEEHFKGLHAFAGEAGAPNSPVGNLIARFNNLYQALSQMQAGGQQRVEGARKLSAELQVMKTESSRLPGIIDNMTSGTVKELQDLGDENMFGQIQQALANEVTRPCLEIARNRYPFSAGSPNDVGLQDFARMFGPAGFMNTYFKQHLADMVDRSGKTWRYLGDTRLSRRLSAKTLRQFQRANEINEAFFASGAAKIDFSVKPVTLSGDAFTVTFDIDGQKLLYEHKATPGMSMSWPGPAGGRVEITVTPEIPGETSRISKNGIWALFRMIRAGSTLNSGNSMSVRFQIGGRNATFEITTNSVRNPFTLRALSEFKCPRGL